MLIGISPLISPELLSVLYKMGHGDEIVLADAHFPADTFGKRVIRADGIRVAPLLDAILPLMALDSYVEHPVIMMAAAVGDSLDPAVETAYRIEIDRYWPETSEIEHMEKAFAVVATGETAKYGNIILKKGVTPVD